MYWLFNNAVIIRDYIVLNVRWPMDWKEVGRKYSCHDHGTIQYLMGWSEQSHRRHEL